MTGFDSKRQMAMDKLVEIQEELGMYDDQKPEQEPVAWADMKVTDRDVGLSWTSGQFHTQPLYTTPPQRKPLTDKQILADETLRYYFGQNGGAGPVSKQGRKVVDAIEAAHGIKGNI